MVSSCPCDNAAAPPASYLHCDFLGPHFIPSNGSKTMLRKFWRKCITIGATRLRRYR